MFEKRETGSVTQWLTSLNDDSAEQSLAQQKLWERYFSRLASLARSRMPLDTRQACDEEDVALSALSSFFRRAGNSEFPHLHDRSGLWPLLARITVFKAIKRVEHERAAKRGGEPTASRVAAEKCELPSIDQVISGVPTPEVVVEIQEQVELLLASLPEQPLREVAELKLAGCCNKEIAELQGIGLRSVERKLARIRKLWSDVSPHRV